MERLLEVGANLPQRVTPVLGPVSTALGEVYQYTLERPDDGKRALTKDELLERRTVQDWVVRPLLRSIPASPRSTRPAATSSSTRCSSTRTACAITASRSTTSTRRSPATTRTRRRRPAAGGGGVSQRGVGLIRDLEDIRSIVLKEIGATPVYIRDVAEITLGEDVRVARHDQGRVLRGGRRDRLDDPGGQREGGGEPRQGARAGDQRPQHAAGRAQDRALLRPPSSSTRRSGRSRRC